MKMTTATGESVHVEVGDHVYVDQGDSVGQTEYSGTVTALDVNLIVVETRTRMRRERPSDVVDLQVW